MKQATKRFFWLTMSAFLFLAGCEPDSLYPVGKTSSTGDQVTTTSSSVGSTTSTGGAGGSTTNSSGGSTTSSGGVGGTSTSSSGGSGGSGGAETVTCMAGEAGTPTSVEAKSGTGPASLCFYNGDGQKCVTGEPINYTVPGDFPGVMVLGGKSGLTVTTVGGAGTMYSANLAALNSINECTNGKVNEQPCNEKLYASFMCKVHNGVCDGDEIDFQSLGYVNSSNPSPAGQHFLVIDVDCAGAPPPPEPSNDNNHQ